MTVEADIKTVLATACPRVFPDFAPVGTTRPYVTYREVPGGTVISPLAKEVPDKENSVFQINVWANSRASAKATIKAIESAMILATTFTAKPVSRPSSDFDADIPEFSTEQEFSVWSNR
jgi:hypothetical protein